MKVGDKVRLIKKVSGLTLGTIYTIFDFVLQNGRGGIQVGAQHPFFDLNVFEPVKNITAPVINGTTIDLGVSK